jgi:hypothetical protein
MNIAWSQLSAKRSNLIEPVDAMYMKDVKKQASRPQIDALNTVGASVFELTGVVSRFSRHDSGLKDHRAGADLCWWRAASCAIPTAMLFGRQCHKWAAASVVGLAIATFSQ